MYGGKNGGVGGGEAVGGLVSVNAHSSLHVFEHLFGESSPTPTHSHPLPHTTTARTQAFHDQRNLY